MLAQPSQHFGSLWHGANFEIARARGTLGLSDRSRSVELILIVKEILCRDLDKEVVYRELVQRSC